MKEINIYSSTIEKSLDLAKDFLQSLVGPSFNELGQLFADNVKVWRVNNQLRNLEKVQRIIKDNNIKTKQVNLKVLFPYLEAVSFEDDENLQDMWANLFANYIDSSKHLNLIVYPQILKQLSTNEVKILSYLNSKNTDESIVGVDLTSDEKKVPAQIDEIANLVRLGLIQEHMVFRTSHGLNSGQVQSGYYKLLVFGKEFLKACSRDSSDA